MHSSNTPRFPDVPLVAAAVPPVCRIQLLGRLAIYRENHVTDRFRTRKTASLLACLACSLDRTQAREELIERFWPETDLEDGRASLRTALSALRRDLEPSGVPEGSVLIAGRDGVRLNPDVVITDVQQFSNAVRDAARATELAVRREMLIAAVELYRGSLLPGFYDDWILLERQRLDQAFANVLYQLTHIHRTMGNRAAALDYAHRLVAHDPHSEPARAVLIKLLREAGRPVEAARQYRDLEQRLKRDLGLAPSAAVRRLAEDLPVEQADALPLPLPRNGDTSICPTMPNPAATANLPRLPFFLTRFVGRASEMTRLAEALDPASPDGSRLVTLTGPGGVGKTRLALEAALGLATPFGGRVWFVPLAEVTDAALLTEAILAALPPGPNVGGDPLDAIAERLGGVPTLLLMDNLEHLVEAGAPVLRRLLERLTSVRLLLTSRRPIGVSGEQVIALSPLLVPRLPASPERLMESDSVRLFVDRARAVRADFTLTQHNAAVVAALCARLDGLPLAIEIAAGWAQTLTPAQILQRLSERFDLPAAGGQEVAARHRTLRATLEWSWRLLDAESQRFLQRLCVFRGHWSLEDAEAVCQEPMALSLVLRLQQHSLVMAEEFAEEMRYRLLEYVRQFAAEQCRAEETVEAARRHREHYLALAERAAQYWHGSEQARWIHRLDLAWDNLRAALQMQDDLPRSLRFGAALSRYWQIRGRWREGLAELRAALDRELTAEENENCRVAHAQAMLGAGVLSRLMGSYQEAERWSAGSLALFRAAADRKGEADALYELGMNAALRGDVEAARMHSELSLRLRREIGDWPGVSSSLSTLGNLARDQGDYLVAKRRYEESLTIARKLEDLRGMATALNNLAVAYEEQGDFLQARPFYQQSLAAFATLGDLSGMGIASGNLGIVALALGDLDAARAGFARALEIRSETGDRRLICGSFEEMSDLALHLGDHARAARFSGAAEALRQALGITIRPYEQAACEDKRSRLEAALGPEAFQTAWSSGRQVPAEEMIRQALDWIRSSGKS